jgi:hypothetical protein
MTTAGRFREAEATATPLTFYSRRRVNPFRGVVAVVRSPGGRALSLDGARWELQVSAYPPRGLWSGDREGPELRYFRFGFWSEAEGTTRVPLTPVLDVGRMLAESEGLVAAIREAAPHLPFSLAPELELWLLGPDDAPLALLATAVDAGALDEIGLPSWHAGGRGERPFQSAALTKQGIPARDGSGPGRHAERLERLVTAAAGAGRPSQWFRREAGAGSGIGLRGPAHLRGRRVAASAFPRFLLRRDWTDPVTQALADDYFRWLSPYLLMLLDLDDDERAELERAAARHALLVSRLWRLYPRVLDDAFIRRARVEAQLRRAYSPASPG